MVPFTLNAHPNLLLCPGALPSQCIHIVVSLFSTTCLDSHHSVNTVLHHAWLFRVLEALKSLFKTLLQLLQCYKTYGTMQSLHAWSKHLPESIGSVMIAATMHTDANGLNSSQIETKLKKSKKTPWESAWHCKNAQMSQNGERGGWNSALHGRVDGEAAAAKGPGKMTMHHHWTDSVSLATGDGPWNSCGDHAKVFRQMVMLIAPSVKSNTTLSAPVGNNNDKHWVHEHIDDLTTQRKLHSNAAYHIGASCTPTGEFADAKNQHVTCAEPIRPADWSSEPTSWVETSKDVTIITTLRTPQSMPLKLESSRPDEQWQHWADHTQDGLADDDQHGCMKCIMCPLRWRSQVDELKQPVTGPWACNGWWQQSSRCTHKAAQHAQGHERLKRWGVSQGEGVGSIWQSAEEAWAATSTWEAHQTTW